MKTKLIDKHGNQKSEVVLPKNFSSEIRRDILLKVFEAQKGFYMQPYGTNKLAGRLYSASGILRRKRHAWKGTYGKGISRVPRKIMSRTGSSFNWIGATVSNTRGGRRPHSSKSEKNLFRKINKKEALIAINSGLTGTIDAVSLEKKYGRKINSGFVFGEDVLKSKTKDFLTTLEKAYGENFNLVLKKKSVRAGAGKRRGRKYKESAGLLFVISDKEAMKRSGIDVVKVSDLRIRDLAPNGVPGRVAAFSENSIKEIATRFENE